MAIFLRKRCHSSNSPDYNAKESHSFIKFTGNIKLACDTRFGIKLALLRRKPDMNFLSRLQSRTIVFRVFLCETEIIDFETPVVSATVVMSFSIEVASRGQTVVDLLEAYNTSPVVFNNRDLLCRSVLGYY